MKKECTGEREEEGDREGEGERESTESSVLKICICFLKGGN